MPRVTLNETHNRKEDIRKYISQLMTAKDMNQEELAKKLGKTQSWMSKKMMHCGFYVGELIEIFRILEADPTEVGRLIVITKEKKR